MPGTPLRVEHLLIYGCAPFAVWRLRAHPRLVVQRPELTQLAVTMAWVTVWTLVVTLIGEASYASERKLISHAERYVRPIAVMALTIAAVGARPAHERERALRRSMSLMVTLLQVNAVVAALSVFIDLRPMLAGFWGPDSVVDGELFNPTYAGGRFTGVFTQAAEAGLAYALGLLCWVYLVLQRGRVGWRDVFGAAMLVVGGMLTVSKVVLFVGLPLAILLMGLTGVGRRMMKPYSLALLGIFGVGVALGTQQWMGWDFLVWTVIGSGDPNVDWLSDTVFRYSGGRVGVDGTMLRDLFARVISEAPVWGLGFGAFTNLDSAYVEFFAQGGSVGLLGYVFLLMSMTWTAVRLVGQRMAGGVLMLFIACLIIVAGLGAPVITMNRFSTMLWVVMALLYPVSDRSPSAAPASLPIARQLVTPDRTVHVQSAGGTRAYRG